VSSFNYGCLKKGWGAVYNGQSIGGQWLEMFAVFLALKSFSKI